MSGGASEESSAPSRSLWLDTLARSASQPAAGGGVADLDTTATCGWERERERKREEERGRETLTLLFYLQICSFKQKNATVEQSSGFPHERKDCLQIELTDSLLTRHTSRESVMNNELRTSRSL